MPEGDWKPPPGSWASSRSVRKTMTSTRGRDTAAELAVRSAAHRRGLRYRVDAQPVAGIRRRADLVFPRQRVAVFVDGCFWHGCPQHYTSPTRNHDFWLDKVTTNRQRDRDTDERLSNVGWTVIRIWEHEDPEMAVDRIQEALTR